MYRSLQTHFVSLGETFSSFSVTAQETQTSGAPVETPRKDSTSANALGKNR